MIGTVSPSKVYVNSTDKNLIVEGHSSGQYIVETAIEALSSFSLAIRREIGRPHATKKYAAELMLLSRSESIVVRAHADGFLLLSPISFTTSSEETSPSETIIRFARCTPLGLAFLGDPAVAELMQRPKNRDTRRGYELAFHRVVASLAMACRGAEIPSDIPEAEFVSWFSLFRTKGGQRWNEELWAKGQQDYMAIALRSVALCYARITNNPQVEARIPQKRSDATQVRFWDDVIQNTPPFLTEWLRYFQDWRKSVKGRTAANHRTAFLQLGQFLEQCFSPKESKSPETILALRKRPSFARWLVEQRNLPSRKKAGVSMVNSLGTVKKLSDFIISELRSSGNTLQFWPLSTKADENELRTIAAVRTGSKHARAQSRPLPMRYYSLAREILEEGEAGWPGQQSACRAMLPSDDRNLREVYCPVLPTLFLTEFELPLRVGQAKRLDSGEGDQRRYNVDKDIWGQNTRPAAGFWARQTPAMKDAGYAHEFPEARFTGFFINTNKTGNPYTIPWPNKKLHLLLSDLVHWQERHNPISLPIPPSEYVDDLTRMETEKLSDLPHIFPMFRMPPGMGRVKAGVPPNARKTNQFWQDLMAEVQARWNASNPDDHHIFVKQHPKTRQYYGCTYNSHGLRVQLLTLLFDAGLPIEILSSVIAGHKSILMSIYYLVRDPAWYAAQLDAASQKLLAVEQARQLAEIKGGSLALASKRAAALNSNAIAGAVSMSLLEKALWIDMGIGICPFGGSRCHDGGECIRKGTRKGGADASIYKPVEGGAMNCVSCRHFLSGTAWLIPLQLFGTREMRRIAGQQQRIISLMKTVDEHRTSRAAFAAGSPDHVRLGTLIARHEQQLRELGEQQEVMVKTLWNTKRYIEACLKLQQQAADDGQNSLVARGDGQGGVGFAEASDFEQAMQIVAFSEIYPILHDEDAERSLEKMLDDAVFEGHIELAALRPLQPIAVGKAISAASRYLLASLSREEMRAVSDQQTTIKHLGHSSGAVEAAEVALGMPIDVLAAFSLQKQRPMQLVS